MSRLFTFDKSGDTLYGHANHKRTKHDEVDKTAQTKTPDNPVKYIASNFRKITLRTEGFAQPVDPVKFSSKQYLYWYSSFKVHVQAVVQVHAVRNLEQNKPNNLNTWVLSPCYNGVIRMMSGSGFGFRG